MNGMALVLVAALLWGVGSLFAKVAVLTVDPWATSLVRSAVLVPVVATFVLRETGLDSGCCTGVPAIARIGVGKRREQTRSNHTVVRTQFQQSRGESTFRTTEPVFCFVGLQRITHDRITTSEETRRDRPGRARSLPARRQLRVACSLRVSATHVREVP